MYYGADYYPEQWPRERWATDARLMRKAGINLVRLAEFAWAQLEPSEGTFDFSWLDDAIALLAAEGIATVLGTPTATPPAWLCHAYPQVLRVTRDGQRTTFGMRRQYCPTSDTYRAHTRRIVTAMAEHYAGHPHVVAWQIDNEFGCHDSTRCYCPECRDAFAAWARGRYDWLAVLNEVWGTAFWSQTYTDWDQVPLPWASTGVSNPALELDYYRFASDQMVAYQQIQVDALRAADPSCRVTTNLMGFGFDTIDYYDLARPLDFISWDNYPLYGPLNPVGTALSHDAVRGSKNAPFWVMEQQAGPCGWQTMGRTPQPGQLRLWAYQAIAHGADAIVYFRWRTARANTETYWYGILDHHGRPGRRYDEIAAMGQEVARLGSRLEGARSPRAVALLQTYDDRWALGLQPGAPGLSFGDIFSGYYRALHGLNVPVDVVSPEAPLEDYALVVAPALHLVSPEAARTLRRYVEAGGALVVGARSGVRDGHSRIVDTPLPGLLRELTGPEVVEHDALGRDVAAEIRFEGPAAGLAGHAYGAHTWVDVLSPQGAHVVARYVDGPYTGRPAITAHRFGGGMAYYVGTVGRADTMTALMSWLVARHGIEPLLKAPDGVEVTAREAHGQVYLFVLNHTHAERRVTLPAANTDLLTDSRVDGALTLAPYQVAILAREA